MAIASAIPPFAVPSSLVSTMPVTSTASPNSFACRRPFWPVVASTVISVSCGASGICLVITRRTLTSSSIRFVLRVQAAGGVDDHDVGAALAAAGDGVEGDRAGIGALGALDELDVGALGPALELLDGGGAERVGGADDDLLAERVAQVPGELADRGRLAGAVDADDEDHRRIGADVDRVVAGAGELGEQLGQPAGQRLAADERAVVGLALEPLDHLRRSCGRRRRRRSAPPRAAPRSPRRGRPRTASPAPRPQAPRGSCASSCAGGRRSRAAARPRQGRARPRAARRRR